jgi:tetratricopeptide (TPR) repeat protein
MNWGLLIGLLAGWLLAAGDRFADFGRDLEREAPGAQAVIVESGRVVWRKGATKPGRAMPVWSSQEYAGERIVWSYEPSLLMIRLPGKKLALTVSTNSKFLTDAARLEDGNVARSTVALAFFRDVAGLGDSERDELIDRGLMALYQGEKEKSAMLAHQALDKFPELQTMPDVTLLYWFAQLRLPETEASATAVIKEHPSPAAWFYYGQYLENSKRYREAAACFEMITMHQPPWHHWTVAAAQKELTYLKTY